MVIMSLKEPLLIPQQRAYVVVARYISSLNIPERDSSSTIQETLCCSSTRTYTSLPAKLSSFPCFDQTRTQCQTRKTLEVGLAGTEAITAFKAARPEIPTCAIERATRAIASSVEILSRSSGAVASVVSKATNISGPSGGKCKC